MKEMWKKWLAHVLWITKVNEISELCEMYGTGWHHPEYFHKICLMNEVGGHQSDRLPLIRQLKPIFF